MEFVRKALKLISRKPILLPIISGFLMAVAFPPSFLWFLAFFGFILLICFLEKEKDALKLFGGFWIFGIVYFGITLCWFFSVLPLDWLGVDNSFLGIVAIFLIWIFSVSAMALPFAFVGAGLKFFNGKWRYAVFPALWIVAEFLSSFMFGLVWFGKNGAIGSNWPFGAIGIISSSLPFSLPLSRFLGIYGMTTLIVLINLSFFFFIKRKRKTALMFSGIVIFAVILSLITNMIFSSHDKELAEKKVSIIQTHSVYKTGIFGGGFLSRPAGQTLSLADKIDPESDLVLLPEGGFYTADEFEKHKSEFVGLLPKQSSILIGNFRPQSGQVGSSKVVVLDSSGKEIILGEKILLVPFSEYLPYPVEFILRSFFPDWLELYKYERPFIRGEKSYLGESSEAVFLCSTVVSPDTWEKAVRDGAELLALSASQWHFKGSAFYGQAEAAIRFFAAETDRYFIQAANGGYSYIIDNNGKVVKRSFSSESLGVISGEVKYLTGWTFAVRFRNWPVYVAVAAMIIILILQCIEKRRKN